MSLQLQALQTIMVQFLLETYSGTPEIQSFPSYVVVEKLPEAAPNFAVESIPTQHLICANINPFAMSVNHFLAFFSNAYPNINHYLIKLTFEFNTYDLNLLNNSYIFCFYCRFTIPIVTCSSITYGIIFFLTKILKIRVWR